MDGCRMFNLDSDVVAISLSLPLKSFVKNEQGQFRIAPSTYEGGKYALSEGAKDVIVNSIAAEANAMEGALRSCAETINLPLIHIADFEGAPVKGLTVLDLPHRVFDGILRDCLDETGVPFYKSDLGKRVGKATVNDPSALYEVAPTSLVFGVWNSTWGGTGHRFARSVMSEIVGEGNLSYGVKAASKMDPYQISAATKVSTKKEEKGLWEIVKGKGGVNPSEVNLGPIAPTFEQKFIYADKITHRTVLSIATLRKLGLPTEQQDALARLALLSALLRIQEGYALRSGCELGPNGPLTITHHFFTGEEKEYTMALTREEISKQKQALMDSLRGCFSGETSTWTPSPKLQELVRASN